MRGAARALGDQLGLAKCGDVRIELGGGCTSSPPHKFSSLELELDARAGGVSREEAQRAAAGPKLIGGVDPPRPAALSHSRTMRLVRTRLGHHRVGGGKALGGVLALPSARWLSTAPDGVGLGFHLRSAADGGHESFVPAARIAGSLLLRTVWVSYERSQLPPGCAEPSLSRVQPPLSGLSRLVGKPPPVGTWHAAGVCAWAFNSLVLWGMWLMLVFVFEARRLMPQGLQASAKSEEEWLGAFASGFGLSFVQSLVLVDAAKVLCLTLTCAPALAACGCGKGEKGCWSKLGKLARKPLRRAHKIMDIIM